MNTALPASWRDWIAERRKALDAAHAPPALDGVLLASDFAFEELRRRPDLLGLLDGSATVGPPPRADERTQQDTLQPVVKTQAGRYSRQLLELTDWCLHLDPQQRPPSVYALQKALIHQDNAPERPEHWFSDLGSRLRSFIGRS